VNLGLGTRWKGVWAQGVVLDSIVNVHGMSEGERKSSAGLDKYFEFIRSTEYTAKIAEIQ
jgi:hypothetical protein